MGVAKITTPYQIVKTRILRLKGINAPRSFKRSSRSEIDRVHPNNRCDQVRVRKSIAYMETIGAIKFLELPYSLNFSKIKYFSFWLNSAQKQIFTNKIFVVDVECELC